MIFYFYIDKGNCVIKLPNDNFFKFKEIFESIENEENKMSVICEENIQEINKEFNIKFNENNIKSDFSNKKNADNYNEIFEESVENVTTFSKDENSVLMNLCESEKKEKDFINISNNEIK